MSVPAADEEMPVWAVRLEAKVDVALARQGDRLDRHGDAIDDHETRLRAIETKPVVTPNGLIGALLATVTLLGGFVAFFDRLTGIN